MFPKLPTDTKVLFPKVTPIIVKVNYLQCLFISFSNNFHFRNDQPLLAQKKFCYIF